MCYTKVQTGELRKIEAVLFKERGGGGKSQSGREAEVRLWGCKRGILEEEGEGKWGRGEQCKKIRKVSLWVGWEEGKHGGDILCKIIFGSPNSWVRYISKVKWAVCSGSGLFWAFLYIIWKAKTLHIYMHTILYVYVYKCIYVYVYKCVCVCVYYIYWLYWVFTATHGLSPAAASKGCLFVVGHRLLTEVLLLLRSMCSRCVASVVAACWLSNCSSWALKLRLRGCGTWT